MNRTLVVAEKFNTALRIAVVLSDGRMKRSRIEGTNVFEFDRPDGHYAVAGLRGHIVELDYPAELREWTLEGLPKLLETVPDKRVTETGIVAALQSIVKQFDRVIIATDFDREGELIGLECLDLLLKVHPKIEVRRARYSALTREVIEQSFDHLDQLDHALAEAGEARQEIDLVWGALLTRFMSITSGQRGREFLSVGRVQTPTLALLVERDQEIKEFKPTPFWELLAHAERSGEPFLLRHAHGTFDSKVEADQVHAKVAGADAGHRPRVQGGGDPPTAADPVLDHAVRPGGDPARRERLDVDADRGGSLHPGTDQLPENGQHGLSARARVARPGREVQGRPVRRGRRVRAHAADRSARPAGATETTDHPPIYPTSAVDPKKLKPDHAKLYELVVRRFLATVAPDAVGQSRTATVEIRGETFEGKGQRILDPGWYRIYPYSHPEESPMPPLAVGESVRIAQIELAEDQTKPPRRFTQGSLIQEMERLGLGTKSTRHDVVQKLFDRHYVNQRQLEPTSTGIAVTEALRAHAPVITRPEMTHRLEEDMELVARVEEAEERGAGGVP